jgi:hypothetical protein
VKDAKYENQLEALAIYTWQLNAENFIASDELI